MKPPREPTRLKESVSKLLWIVIGVVIALAIKYYWPERELPVVPPDFSVSINSFAVHRVLDQQTPEASLRLVLKNTGPSPVTCELREIIMYDDSLSHQFIEVEHLVNLLEGEKKPLVARFRDTILNSVLRIPPTEGNTQFKVVVKNTSTNAVDTLVMLGQDVMKCTYHLYPVFETEREGLQIADNAFPGELVYYIQAISADSFATVVKEIPAFLDQNSRLDLQELRSKEDSTDLYATLYFNSQTTYQRHFGGRYVGMLARDTTQYPEFRHPAKDLTTEEYIRTREMIELLLEHSIDSLAEFLLYSFDSASFDPHSIILQNNARIGILLLFQEEDGLASPVDELRNLGYAVSATQYNELEHIIKAKPTLHSESERPLLIEEILSADTAKLNQVFRENGVLLIAPSFMESSTVFTVVEGFTNVFPDREFILSDYRPHSIAPWNYASRTNPIVAIFDFGKRTLEDNSDSLQLTVDSSGN